MRVIVLTLFPEMFPGALATSVLGQALRSSLWQLETINIRDYGVGKHQQVDDTPYGGGAGMVMRADVVSNAIEAAYARLPDAQLLYMTPRGRVLTQSLISATISHSPQDYIFLCGRFESIDQRVIDYYNPLEISIGDYILCGGELAAQVMIESMLRLVPSILGNHATHDEESFSIGEERACLLEYPHYTKPPVWNDRSVPAVLTSGHHGNVALWRKQQAEAVTKERRTDLWNTYNSVKAGSNGEK